jgi:outer membrane autotransporter protein
MSAAAHQRARRKRSNGERGGATLAALTLVTLGLPQAAVAQTFDEASLPVLVQICSDVGGGTATGVGPNLVALCGGNAPTGVISAAPAVVSPQAAAGPAIERRLQAVRESEERRREAGLTRAIPASYGGDLVLAANGQVQLPPAGGATPEIVIGEAQGVSVFASAGATALNHHNNRFEDGYEAQLPTVTVGADYWITPRLLAGGGFNYTNFDGTYDDGGGFDKDIFSPLLYATFLPFDRAFINAVIGYSRNENSNNRNVVVPLSDGSVFTGRTSADYDENQYSATLQAGYDHPIDNFTIGPRLGFAYGYSQVGSFKEKGNTGAELRYSGLNQTSVQTSLGAAATVAIAIPYGVLLPQASVAWVHEYANDARNVQARFVDAPGSPKFTFQRERPARNWANIGLGVSASLLNGMQPFAQFQTVQGNDNFVSYGGTAGLRFSF